jgi:UDP-N-acetylglucosamine enolpyruvyl transferase
MAGNNGEPLAGFPTDMQTQLMALLGADVERVGAD